MMITTRITTLRLRRDDGDMVITTLRWRHDGDAADDDYVHDDDERDNVGDDDVGDIVEPVLNFHQL